jgi:predicted dehydrogenase
MNRHKKPTIGIIGCGAVVQSYYSKILPLIKNLTVGVVCDINTAFAEAVAAKLGARAGSIEDVLKASDLCVIATPPNTHFQLSALCLDARCDVFCEKPFVGTRTEAESLVTKASQVGQRIYVGHFRRNYPSVDLARSLIETGSLGAVKNISIFEGGRFSWNTTSAYISSDQFGGVLYDTGSHAIDMALYAAGLDCIPVRVQNAQIERDKEEPSHIFKGKIYLETVASSVALNVYFSRFEALANIVRIRLEHGTLEFSTGLDNSVNVKGPTGLSVLRSSRQYTDAFQCFRRQFDLILANNGGIFDAARFTNLTAVLEGLVVAKSNKKLCHELL